MIYFISTIILITLSISATPLSEAVVNMKEKSWRPLSTVGNLVLRTGDQGEGIYGFGHEVVWEPKSQQLMFVGAGHHDPMTFNLYNSKTNEWRTEPMDRLRVSGEELQDHSYDHLTADDKGNFYFFKKRNNIFNTDTNAWVSTLALDSSLVGISATEFFPDLKSIFYLKNGTVSFYKTETGVWEKNISTRAMGSMHQIAEYNRVHHVMLFGGGTGSRQFYVMDTSRIVRALKAVPFDIELTTCLMAADPVSGKMMVLKDGQDSLYAWDIISDTWEKVCKIPFVNFTAQNSAIAHIDDHGVIAILGYQYPVTLFKYQDNKDNATEKKIKTAATGAICFPNPFTTSTKILISGNHKGINGIEILNSKGQRVKFFSIPSFEKREIMWDRRDNFGHAVSAGMYYGKIISDHKNNAIFPIIIIQ